MALCRHLARVTTCARAHQAAGAPAPAAREQDRPARHRRGRGACEEAAVAQGWREPHGTYAPAGATDRPTTFRLSHTHSREMPALRACYVSCSWRATCCRVAQVFVGRRMVCAPTYWAGGGLALPAMYFVMCAMGAKGITARVTFPCSPAAP